MRHRTFILFAIFCAVAVAGLAFTLAYNGLMGQWLQSYALRIRRCEYLSAALCDRHPFCQSYYEISQDGTQTPEFRECRTVSQKIVVEADVCQKTGGVWRRVQFGSYCDCSGSGKQYAVDKGCQ